ncbi:hypothetical protein ES288_D02G248300v1 [Gossypium darwinii]|uniref:HVA22-like protein n=1 Tax=Gossypium darwinii TaxID=34276 RepID=A0A5D2DIC7_GOSDA|nr:hypothetical protein ES288_D02G248300v1 [Gossypium darwinii]
MGFQALVKLALICFHSLAWPLFALGYPLRASIQAIEANSNTDTKKLVTYWIIFSLISLFEHAFMGILQWLPFWPYMKLTIVCWMMIPHFDGAFYVYNHFVHPCLYMDLPTIINWFKKQQDLFLKDNFLVEVADDCVKAHGPTEVQEKLIANEGTETSILQKCIKPVQIAEKSEVAPIRKTDPNVIQTVNNTTVTLSETVGEVGPDLPKISSDKQVQKEWTCAMCQVTTTSKKTLKSHLRGRKHKNKLMQANNQPCKGKAGLASKVKQSEVSRREPQKQSEVSRKEPQKKGSKNYEPPKGQMSASSAACSNAVNPKTEMSKSNLPKEEWKKVIPTTNMVGNHVKSSENVQGQQQQVEKEHCKTKIPQFRCTICNITCGPSEDLNSHLWGRKHLAKLNSLGRGQLA